MIVKDNYKKMDSLRQLRNHGIMGTPVNTEHDSTRWVGYVGLLAGLSSLPLPPTGMSPDLSAALALVSIMTLAGHGWARPICSVLAAILLATWTAFVAEYGFAVLSSTERTCLTLMALSAVPCVFVIAQLGTRILEFFGLDAMSRTIAARTFAPVAWIVAVVLASM